MPTEFIKDHELDYTVKDVINAVLEAILTLLHEIDAVEPKHLKSYVAGIKDLMAIVMKRDSVAEALDDDEDFKDFMENLPGSGVIKVGIKGKGLGGLEDLLQAIADSMDDDDEDEE